MNKKGFTLIELIATIALLGIIVTISFVSINKVLETGKKNDCIALVQNIKSASKEYASDNRYNRIFTNTISNNTKDLNVKVLVDEHYLSKPIINPFDNKEIPESDFQNIKIKLTFNNNYTVNTVDVKYYPSGNTSNDVFEICK